MEISDRLGKLATFYHREARKCLRGRAYLAACVMQGAALEAVLQAMCFLYPADIKKTAVYQKKKSSKRGFRRKRNKALDFNYFELINIAVALYLNRRLRSQVIHDLKRPVKTWGSGGDIRRY